MSKFNSKGQGTKTTNLAGGKAYKLTNKIELITILLTTFVTDQFYRTENELSKKICGLISNFEDKKFVAKAIIYARTIFGMRSISHIGIGEIINQVKRESWVKGFIEKAIYRVDDITEIFSYYINKYGKPIPNCMKKGFGLALNKFDEYQIAKYRSDSKKVKLVDVVNMCHIKPSKELDSTFKKLMKGQLVSTDTWESELTRAGQLATNKEEKIKYKKDVWIRLINKKKIGYFALLRNLRNIIEQAPEILDKALDMLVDEKLIKSSLVLPFRFTTAIAEIEKINNSRNVLVALNKAVDISLYNVPKLEGKTLIALDESGSMKGKPIEIGSLFASILYKTNDSVLLTFSEDARFRNLNPNDSTLTIANILKKDFICAGTDIHSIFRKITQKFDRIIILSDMQGWIGYESPVSSFNKYKELTGANPYIYSWDLQGYGTVQFPESKIFRLAGFSSEVFNIIKMLESDKNALVNEIEKIEI